jgi:hypothetical protein
MAAKRQRRQSTATTGRPLQSLEIKLPAQTYWEVSFVNHPTFGIFTVDKISSVLARILEEDAENDDMDRIIRFSWTPPNVLRHQSIVPTTPTLSIYYQPLPAMYGRSLRRVLWSWDQSGAGHTVLHIWTVEQIQDTLVRLDAQYRAEVTQRQTIAAEAAVKIPSVIRDFIISEYL